MVVMENYSAKQHSELPFPLLPVSIISIIYSCLRYGGYFCI